MMQSLTLLIDRPGPTQGSTEVARPVDEVAVPLDHVRGSSEPARAEGVLPTLS